MNEITIKSKNLPANVEDLSKFVLVGREKLNAVRAMIRAIDKVGVAAEIHRQKLEEAQELGEAVLDAEVRLGELRASVPRETAGRPKKIQSDDRPNFNTPIQEFDAAVGFGSTTMKDTEKISNHPDLVEKVKSEAREAGEIVTRKAVLDAIKAEKRKELKESYRRNVDTTLLWVHIRRH